MICGFCGVETTETDSYISEDGRYRICIAADECLERQPPVLCNLCRRDIPVIDQYRTYQGTTVCIDAGPCLTRQLNLIVNTPTDRPRIVRSRSQADIMKGWATNV